MTWQLNLSEIHSQLMSGRDDARRAELFPQLLRKHAQGRCLQVGVQGERKYADHFVSIDLYDTRPVIDVRCDLAKTPFQDGEFDLIVCNAILEHVHDPFGCVKEMYRIAKPRAEVWVEIPFVQPFHPTKKRYESSDGWMLDHIDQPVGGEGDFEHGGDYWRFTPQGLALLMRPFRFVEMMLVADGGIAYHGIK